MKRFAAAVAFALTACAAPQTSWIAAEHDKAENGQLAWSAYYSEYLQVLAQGPVLTGKADYMDMIERLRQRAMQYESGAITYADFQESRRQSVIEEARIFERSQPAQPIIIQQRPIYVPVPQAPAYRPPSQTTCTQAFGQINCTTN